MSKFFHDLTILLDSLFMLSLPITIICDLNIHIKRPDNVDHRRLLELQTAFVSNSVLDAMFLPRVL